MQKQLQKVIDDINKYKTVDNVLLVGVTKTRTIEQINKLVALGVDTLGENRPQELRDKYDSQQINASWHMIGRLQSNKIKYVINRCELIHSIADYELLEKVNDAALKNDKCMEVLLQLNTSLEESKQGFYDNELEAVLLKAKSLLNVKVVGFMCMAPLDVTEAIVNDTFKQAKELYDKYNDNFKYLSMGMSTDYIIALKNGANLIRVGSLLFEED